MLRLRSALLLRAAAKDIKLCPEAARTWSAAFLAVRGQPVIGTLLLVSNLPPRLHPARPDLSVARALCARLRSRSAREVARRVLAA